MDRVFYRGAVFSKKKYFVGIKVREEGNEIKQQALLCLHARLKQLCSNNWGGNLRNLENEIKGKVGKHAFDQEN